jgi:hypothetical protein
MVSVYALPSEYRSKTKIQLMEKAMPLFKRWLNDIGDIEDFGSYRKSFYLNLTSGSIEESELTFFCWGRRGPCRPKEMRSVVNNDGE